MALKRLLYKNIFKPIFFRLDPELIHDTVVAFGGFFSKFTIFRGFIKTIFAFEDRALSQNLWGIDFKNPVGLAAGFDKDGKLFPLIGSVGFGFATIGTVTKGAYEGNPKPRLHRLPKSKSLVVNYGLKSMGAQKVADILESQGRRDVPKVISVGRTNSKETASLEDGVLDYINCAKEFNSRKLGDIFEINISCPNVFGGEPFTHRESLERLLSKFLELKIEKPIFLKMPINLPWEEFKNLVDVALKFGVKALVIGNLNKDRSFLSGVVSDDLRGNMSGKPTAKLANELISKTYLYCGEKLKIIGVGGIFSAEDAYEKIKRGASLVELITGMIYEGPQLAGEINRGLAKMLKRDGFKNIKEAIGTFKS